MITVTVKTLDSQNHQFTVDDGYTVEQFKRHIEGVVNITAERQRIIYCGRVLQDSCKLKDYDVDGKVVHLVQRAPPNTTNRNARSVTPPPDLNRARGGFRGFNRVGNTVYMGMESMTFPHNLMDPQQMIPPRASHTLSASRLNVARRMLRNAENVIRLLEDPSATSEQPTSEETPEEEMTPVIEARVIVPSNGDQPIDENAIVNAVENTIFEAGVSNNLDQTAGTSGQSNDTPNSEQSSASTPETSTPRSSSAENLTAENNGEPSRQGGRSSRLRCRGTEMAELLTTLNQLHLRFAPFLSRYQSFMQEDPQVSQENLQQTRYLINRVSQVLHFLGHAYHSLSDIMINVDQPPPRLLLCRPILIQHSAVVQAGIPIQVEAQINLSTDRTGATSTSTGTTSTTTTTNTAASTTVNNTTSSTPSTATYSSSNHIPPNFTFEPGFVGLPFMPTGSMRVITTPVEIRTVRANVPRQRPANNNNNTPTTTPSAPPINNQNQTSGTQAQAPSEENAQSGQGQGIPFGGNNGNLEFFMEVTPEGITIDSLESALADSNQAANEFIRNGNLIQSLMQLVGSQLGGSQGLGPTQSQPQPQATASTGDLSQQNQGQSQSNSQSQARSNTQTNPTTATHTRSTSRPHVHMTQQAVQGGFDPFLPCYSHHVTHSRSQRIVPVNQTNQAEPTASRDASAASAQTSSTSTQTNQQTPTQRNTNNPPILNNMISFFDNIIRSPPSHITNLPNVLEENRRTAQMLAEAVASATRSTHQQSPPEHQPQRGAPDGQGSSNTSQQNRPHDMFAVISNLMGQNLPDLLGNGPTLYQYVETFHPEPYVRGESLINDLIMSMLINLRLNDLFMIFSGNMSPLHRQMDTIQGFFLTEVCQNDTSDAGIQRATERFINNFRPLINALESIPARENIDIVRTIDCFFRQQLPVIIRLAVSSDTRTEGENPNSSTLLTSIWRAAKELLALALYCNANGQQGVEAVCEEVLFSTIFNQSNIPSDIHNWTISNSRSALRTFINNLDVTPAEIQQYVIKTESENISKNVTNETRTAQNVDVEAMEVDCSVSPTETGQVLETPIKVEETEPLPNVIWGSEPWHRQTPEEWVPIITRDIQKQRRQNSQPPFSDAYLSGMPSKRRKIINKSKPQGSLSQVISESVHQAVTATGLTSAASLDVVAEAAGQSQEIQTAYRALLRSTVQANLRDNEDFTAERFPNTANYFNGTSPE